MDNKEIFEIITVICLSLIPIIFYITYKIQDYRQSKYCNKVFNNISIGDEYDLIVQDIDDPFEPPYVSHYKVTNKKSTANGLFVQLENKLSRGKKSINVKNLIEDYKKI